MVGALSKDRLSEEQTKLLLEFLWTWTVKLLVVASEWDDGFWGNVLPCMIEQFGVKESAMKGQEIFYGPLWQACSHDIWRGELPTRLQATRRFLTSQIKDWGGEREEVAGMYAGGLEGQKQANLKFKSWFLLSKEALTTSCNKWSISTSWRPLSRRNWRFEDRSWPDIWGDWRKDLALETNSALSSRGCEWCVWESFVSWGGELFSASDVLSPGNLSSVAIVKTKTAEVYAILCYVTIFVSK